MSLLPHSRSHLRKIGVFATALMLCASAAYAYVSSQQGTASRTAITSGQLPGIGLYATDVVNLQPGEVRELGGTFVNSTHATIRVPRVAIVVSQLLDQANIPVPKSQCDKAWFTTTDAHPTDAFMVPPSDDNGDPGSLPWTGGSVHWVIDPAKDQGRCLNVKVVLTYTTQRS